MLYLMHMNLQIMLVWGFDPQNGTSWNVTDSFTSMNPGTTWTEDDPSCRRYDLFQWPRDTGWPYPAGTELWAYTTNQTTWLAADINGFFSVRSR